MASSYKLIRHAIFGLRRPDLMLRAVTGRSVIEIDLAEIERHIGVPRTVLEAGACDGNDTYDMAMRWPGAMIHSTEPVPGALARTRERTAALPNVRVGDFALGTHDGTIQIHVSSRRSGGDWPDSSSVLPATGHLALVPDVEFNEAVDVPCKRLDTWVAEVGAARVDLLWLDLQGFELSVLRASQGAVARTDAIVLEVSRIELYEGSGLLADVLQWAGGAGFEVVIDRVHIAFGNMLLRRRHPS